MTSPTLPAPVASSSITSTARPAALAWSAENCTVGRAMEILGEKWTVHVLREAFMGIRRFEDLRIRTRIPRQVLTSRLAMLVDRGLLKRVPYQEPGARVRFEYRLTQKGLDLYPVLVALRDWGDRYLADPEGPPLETIHRDCGEQVHVVLRCADGHAVPPRDVIPRPGPGLRPLEPPTGRGETAAAEMRGVSWSGGRR